MCVWTGWWRWRPSSPQPLGSCGQGRCPSSAWPMCTAWPSSCVRSPTCPTLTLKLCPQFWSTCCQRLSLWNLQVRWRWVKMARQWHHWCYLLIWCEMHVNVVFVIRCLYSIVSLTLVREKRCIKIIYYYYYLLIFVVVVVVEGSVIVLYTVTLVKVGWLVSQPFKWLVSWCLMPSQSPDNNVKWSLILWSCHMSCYAWRGLW